MCFERARAAAVRAGLLGVLLSSVSPACTRSLNGARCDRTELASGEVAYQCLEGACCADGRCWPSCEGVLAPQTTTPSQELGECETSLIESRWCWSNPLPHGRALFDIWGTRADDLWAAGAEGALFHWNGAKWSAAPGPSDWILGLWGATEDDFWTVTRSTLYHSLGDQYPNENEIFNVWGVARDDVWAFQWPGALHWNGHEWTAYTGPHAEDLHLFSGWGTATDDVWAVGYTIWHWDGESWQESLDLATLNRLCGYEGVEVRIQLEQVRGTSAQDVWVASDETCTLHFTVNGWERAEEGFNSLFEIHGSSDVGAIDAQGDIRRWNGTAWEPIGKLGPSQGASAVWADTSSQLWTVDGGGLVRHLRDGKWSEQSPAWSTTSEELSDVHGTSPDNVWVVGRAGTLRHFDGTSWRPEESLTDEDLSAIWAVSAEEAWAVGTDGTILHRTLDAKSGKAQWSAEFAEVEGDLNDVWAADANDVWCVGDNGAILRRQGAGWVRFRTPRALNLFGIWGVSSDDLWIVGGTAASASGESSAEPAHAFHWRENKWLDYDLNLADSAPPAAPLESSDEPPPQADCIDFKQQGVWGTPNRFGAVAVWGTGTDDVWVAMSCNGTAHWDGVRWSRFAPDRPQPMRGIWQSGERAFRIGDWGHIDVIDYRVDSDWRPASQVSVRWLNAVWGLDSEHVWAVGAYGAILRLRP